MKRKATQQTNTIASVPCVPLIEPPVEKYSLRQRQKRSTRNANKQTENSTKVDEIPADNTISEASTNPTTPIVGTAAQTKSTTKSGKEKTKSKAKQKAAPLSKYRRKTANARERIRMREINSAFEHLRKCVPVSMCDGSPTTTNEKLTKITTLRLAMNYIQTLGNLLTSGSSDYSESILLDNIINKTTFCAESSSNFMNNNNDNTLINNNNTELDAIKLNATPSPKKGKRKSKKATETITTSTPATANKTISKRRTTKTKANTLITTTSNVTKSNRKTNLIKPLESAYAMTAVNAMSTICMTPPSSLTDSPIDLGLMLESDGESLHLSEPCLSPPLLSGNQPMTKTFDCSTTLSPPTSMTTSNGLDIGMFLESDTDSLHFPEPLDDGFDVLSSPFGDLLHASFAEHSSLDIYLT